MAIQDRTDIFKQAVNERTSGSSSGRAAKRRKINGLNDPRASPSSKEFTGQAYQILNHVHSLSRLLSQVSRPYLNTTGSAVSSMSVSQLRGRSSIDGSLDAWANVNTLTDEERDQIDTEVKEIISKCAERVKQMESAENARRQSRNRRVGVAKLLPPRLLPEYSDPASDSLTAHHASITWYLNRKLAEMSIRLRDLQEKRVLLHFEKSNTLGARAGGEAIDFESNPRLSLEYVGSHTGSSTATPWPSTSAKLSIPSAVADPEEELLQEPELTPAQLEIFESENNSLLQAMQSNLASVQQAESRLLEISALQTELVVHLTQQTELTDKLYDDAIASTEMAEKGNLQLKEAQRRTKDSRLYILVFLLGATFALLFLHYY